MDWSCQGLGMGMRGLDGWDYKEVVQDSSLVTMEPFCILIVVMVICLYA